MAKVLLSFDTEEFDVPREHGVDFTLADGMGVSVIGTRRILDVLKSNGVRATFFCTGNFAVEAPDMMHRIMDEGHEVACHGVDHWEPKPSDYVRSKEMVEGVTGLTVNGYRQPRMNNIDGAAIKAAGYRYNASLNPGIVPGHYMHLNLPRTWFVSDGMMQIPASTTPWVRFPMFWLSLHWLPEWLYHYLTRQVLRHDGYFTTYFHPWEFYELGEHPEMKMPLHTCHNSGQKMADRLDRLIKMLLRRGHEFITYMEFALEKQCAQNSGLLEADEQ